MQLFRKCLCLLSICNILVCLALVVVGYVNYSWVAGGTTLNKVGSVVAFFSFFCMLLFIGVYKFISSLHDNLDFPFPRWAILGNVLLISNSVYIMHNISGPLFEANTEFTGWKLMFFLSISLIVNFNFFAESYRFVRH